MKALVRCHTYTHDFVHFSLSPCSTTQLHNTIEGKFGKFWPPLLQQRQDSAATFHAEVFQPTLTRFASHFAELCVCRVIVFVELRSGWLIASKYKNTTKDLCEHFANADLCATFKRSCYSTLFTNVEVPLNWCPQFACVLASLVTFRKCVQPNS